VLFVYRNGFRRRRLVTSLLDPILFPASELAQLYHMRGDIETFYRDFKQTMRATSWQCRTPNSFHQELLVHMIFVCLIRIAMLDASQLAKVPVAQLSFARALTETRLFFQLLLSAGQPNRWTSIWTAFIKCCAQYLVKYKVLCTISCQDQTKPTFSTGPAAVSEKKPRLGAQASGT
jgi:hypothetical protein